jgi:hypothetical protein
MDEASYLLENIVDVQQKLPSPSPPLVDELVNLVPSSVNLVDQVIHLVQSSIELVDQVIDLISTSIDLTLPLEIELKWSIQYHPWSTPLLLGRVRISPRYFLFLQILLD